MSNQLLLRRRMMTANRPDYLRFTALEDGCTLSLNKVGNPTDHPTEYSFNKGAFMPYVFGTTINFDEGDTIEWRRSKGYESNSFSHDNYNHYQFTTSGNINQNGLITSLLSKDENITSIGSFAFRQLITASDGFTGSLTLQDGIVSIGSYAFHNCDGFTGDLILPDSLTSIGANAFSNCGGFSGLTLPNGLTSIGINAFHSCRGFTGDLILPDSLTSIGANAFHGCSGFNGNLKISNSLSIIEPGVFYGNNFIGELYIPDSVTVIKGPSSSYVTGGAFENCMNFLSLRLSNNLTTIGSCAFQSCIGLSSLTIPDSVTLIGFRAFSSCIRLTGQVTIPDSVTEIKDRAFQSCLELTGAFTIGNNVTFIDSYAFNNCTGLSCFVLKPTTPPSLGTNIFYQVNKPIYVSYSADHSILNAYKTAANWSTYADIIFELDENGEIPE